MTGEHREFPKLPEVADVIGTAEAIAEREMLEDDFTTQTISEVTGQTYPVSEEVRQRRLTARTAYFIQKVEDPSKVISLDDHIDAIVPTYSEHFGEISPEDHERANEDVKDLLRGIGQRLSQETGIDDEKRAEEFEKIFASAHIVANEYTVSIADVYRQDNLFNEAVKKAYKPEEFVELHSRVIDGMSENTISAFTINFIEKLIPPDVREEMTDDEMFDLIAEIQLDPETIRKLEDAKKTTHAVIKKLIISRFERFWGSEALHNLPQEQQDKLGLSEKTQTTKTVDVGGIAITGVNEQQAKKLEAREAFVRDYFAQRGWDAENPTIEQIMEVRSQPGWKHPKQ